MTKVIDTSVRHWEMRRSALTMPDTDPQLTAEILIDCFDDIAHVVATNDTASWHDAHEAVRTRLLEHWGKPPGTAAAVARHTLEYWDTTAGVFITDTPQGNLTARTRLFAEIVHASWAIRDPEANPVWMRTNLAASGRRQTVRLAASMSLQAAESLIELALSEGDLVHDTFVDGTAFDSGMVYRYRDAQLVRLSRMPDHCPKTTGHAINLDAGRSPRAELAAKIAEEDLDPVQAQQLIQIAAGMGAKQQAVITALCTQRQAAKRATPPTPGELDIIEAGLSAASGMDSDAEFAARIACAEPLVRFGVEHLLHQRPHTLPHVVKATRLVPLDTFEWVDTELAKLGYADALAELLSGVRRGPMAALITMSKSLTSLIEFLAELDTSPTRLTRAPRRRRRARPGRRRKWPVRCQYRRSHRPAPRTDPRHFPPRLGRR